MRVRRRQMGLLKILNKFRGDWRQNCQSNLGRIRAGRAGTSVEVPSSHIPSARDEREQFVNLAKTTF